MIERKLTIAEIILIAGTRVALGAGIGLLLSSRLNAVLSGDSSTVSPNDLVEVYEGREFSWRELFKFAQPF